MARCSPHHRTPVPSAGGWGAGIFEALNALFSGLAFVGVIVAIRLQSEELELQRGELRAAREQAKRSVEAQETSAKLSALTALVAHYQPIAASPLNPNSLDAEARLRDLIPELERTFATASGRSEATAVFATPSPVIVSETFSRGVPGDVRKLRDRYHQDGYDEQWVQPHRRKEFEEAGWIAPKLEAGCEVHSEAGKVWYVRQRLTLR